MKAKISFVFAYNGLNKNGEGLIQVRIHIKRHDDPLVSTEVYVRPDQWINDNKTQPARVINHLQADLYTAMIYEKKTEIEEFEADLLKKGGQLTSQLLKDFLSGRRRIAKNLNQEFEDILNRISGKYDPDTLQAKFRMLEILNEFSPNINPDEFNYSFVSNFDGFLRQKFDNEWTVWKIHKDLGALSREASAREVISGKNPYEVFKNTMPSGRTVYLTPTELDSLTHLSYTNPKQQLDQFCLDVFLFACYTGLRISDLLTLENEHITRNPNGDYILNKTLIKGRNGREKRVSLNISKLFDGRPYEIFIKYRNIGGGKLFKGLVEQTINRKIKDIANDAGITKEVTMHVARHTFGTMIALVTKDPFTVMRLMGHTKIETSMGYIHHAEAIESSELDKINWGGLLNPPQENLKAL